MSKFELNQAGIEALMREVATNGMKDVAEDMQRNIDRIEEQYKGHPVSVIVTALRQVVGDGMNESDQTAIAEAIARGQHVELRLGEIQF